MLSQERFRLAKEIETVFGPGETVTLVGVEALVDRYGRGDHGRGETRSPEAVTLSYDLYRTENKVAIAVSHEVTLHEAGRRGWQWSDR